MSDLILSWTSLPNLHPALVHFPIALALVALAVDVGVVGGRRAGWDRAAAGLWILAALGALASYLTGEAAHEGLGSLPAVVHTAVESHEKWGLAAAIGLGLAALARAGLAWRDAQRERPRRDPVRVLVLLGAAGVAALVLRTADLGGALVFTHGVGVEAAAIGASAGDDSDHVHHHDH